MNEKKERYLDELCSGMEKLELPAPIKKSGNTVNILALGDVGANLLMGLRLLGEDIISRIGIFDINENVAQRFEKEVNQTGWPFSMHKLPEVECIQEEELFDCDMFVFCASKAVPPLETSGDVRMMQLEANGKIAEYYGKLAKEAGFKGIFAVVSDPVDPLCKKVLLSSGFNPAQVRGYGLGVMNKRAEYYASKDERFSSYLTEGRAFGPHGNDLVIANSIENYNQTISEELTRLTVEANLRVRELGFKPYLAPSFSSGAISLILTLSQEWCYSSVYFGKGDEGAFLGIKNRISGSRIEYENLPLPQQLYDRIERAYKNLCALV